MTPYRFDFLLAGATGQIGKLLNVYLQSYGSVYKVTRSTEELPPARHVINAGGYTLFDSNVAAYWNDNIRLSVVLAHHAQATGAMYHQLSSEAVAEYRTTPLPETVKGPAAHPKMIDYALSKVLMEAAVASIVDPVRLSVYRCSDVVPPYAGDIGRYWRNNHWLAILFASGRDGFAQNDDFPVWIAPLDELVRALVILIRESHGGAYHLLGSRYTWRQFHSTAMDLDESEYRKTLVKRVTPVVRIDPPLATCIYAKRTDALLKDSYEFEWSILPKEYWQIFAKYAIYKEKTS